MPRDRLTLFDYSDRELLLIVAEAAERSDGGYASTLDVADELGVTGAKRLQVVGARLGAMKRLGLVERDGASKTTRWRPTRVGSRFADGQINDERAAMIVDDMDDGELLLLTRRVSLRQRRMRADGARHIIRREWVRNTTRNK